MVIPGPQGHPTGTLRSSYPFFEISGSILGVPVVGALQVMFSIVGWLASWFSEVADWPGG